jgi:peptide deformylase
VAGIFDFICYSLCMAIRPILQNGDPVLREVSIPVPQELFGTPELAQIIADMTDTLDQQPDGVALAAPQIGISYRMFVVRHDRTLPSSSDDEDTEGKKAAAPVVPDVGVFINPEFVKSSRRRSEVDEGCLSVRGIYGTTLRHDRATIHAQTADGKKFERGGGGLLAQIFQHETDHLDGILFIDHAIDLINVDELKRRRAKAAEESSPGDTGDDGDADENSDGDEETY